MSTLITLNLAILSDNQWKLSLSDEFKNKEITFKYSSTSKEIEISPFTSTSDTPFKIPGKVLGSYAFNNYLIIFSKLGSLLDAIYGINFNKTPLSLVTFFKGDLNFKEDSKFEITGVYENDTIQKVYWIDGINLPRCINIAEDLNILRTGNVYLFDFLIYNDQLLEVDILKQYETGVFKAGTVQYAFNYYNKNGVLTNLISLTPIQYVSSINKGNEVDVPVNCSFKLTCRNINTNFDYLRIYSIHRASEDTTPSVRIVTDISTKYAIAKEHSNKVIEHVDNGLGGTLIDYSSLLFMNNLTTVPKTMTTKDNTLFLGNVLYTSQYDIELKEAIEEANILLDSSIFQHRLLVSDSKKQYYPYTNQTLFSSDEILGFKGGEHYMFGLMVLDYNDRWTAVIPLGNPVINHLYPKVEENTSLNTYDVYIVKAILSKDFIKNLLNIVSKVYNYKSFKIVIATLNSALQRVLCQGIVAPTLFDAYERTTGALPYAKSSWFFRPMMIDTPDSYSEKLTHTDTKNEGSIFEFRHYKGVVDEIPTAVEDAIGVTTATGHSRGSRAVDSGMLGVDNLIITINSPDIEFNDSLRHILKDNNIYNFRIIGYTKIHSSYADSNITSSDSLILMDGDGNIITSYINKDKKFNTYSLTVPAAGLSSYFGVLGPTYATFNFLDYNAPDTKTGWLLYDSALQKSNCQGSAKDATLKLFYKVYPWNRSTTLNALTTPEKNNDSGSISDWMVPLLNKVISNVRCCGKTVLGESHYWEITNRTSSGNGISSIDVWDETDKLLKLKDFTLPIGKDITYQGNIDTVINGNYKTEIYRQSDTTTGTKTYELIKGTYSNCSDLIRVKYNSSAHAVLAFNYNYYKDGEILRWLQWTLPLPTHNSSNTLTTKTTVDSDIIPAWLKDSEIISESNSGSSPNYSEFPEEYVLYAYENPEFMAQYFDSDGKLNISFININSKTTAFIQDVCVICNILEISNYGVLVILIHSVMNSNVSNNRNLSYTRIVLYTIGTNNTILIFPASYLEDGYIFKDINSSKLFKVYTGRGGDSKLTLIVVLDNVGENADENAVGSGELFILEPYVIEENDDGIFYIGELYLDITLDTSEYTLLNYSWLAASKEISFNDRTSIELYGDTYFLRYDALKTYAVSDEDANQIVDIGSFMVETRINIDGRWDNNRGSISNNDMHNKNFNLLNKAYTLKDKMHQNVIDSTVTPVKRYPNTVTWTLTKVFGEDIDSWTSLNNTSILSLDGDQGELVKLINFLNTVLFFLDTGLGYIKYNENVALLTNSALPIELANSGKVDGRIYLNKEIGCQNKDTVVMSKNALYFIDGNTATIYLLKSPLEGAAPIPLSDNAFVSFLRLQDLDNTKAFYNRLLQDIYFVFLSNSGYPCLTYNEQVQNFTSFYSYLVPFMENIGSNMYHILNESDNTASIWILNKGDYNYFYHHAYNDTDEDLENDFSPFYITIVANGTEALKDKIWNNLEFRADSWDSEGTLQSFNTFDQLRVWNEYQWGSSELTRVGYLFVEGRLRKSINITSSLKKKFRIWRANFPRAMYAPEVFINGIERTIPDIPDKTGEFSVPYNTASYSRDRIRNPWTYVLLGKWNANNYRTVLHDMVVYYYE